MGSGYLLGSGTSRFREGSGHTWLSTRFREPYHGFEQPEPGLCQSSGITGTPILRHPANPEFGEARFQQHWVPTRFREPPQMRTHCLDILPGLCHRFRTGTRSEFWQGSEVPETTQGSDIRRGLYQGSCYGQGPRKPICKETKVPGPKGPGQRAIADRGGGTA